MKEKVALLRERASRLPRISLTVLPTPVQDCPRFSAELGHGVRVFMKRDDLMMAGFGGNKVRKLEFSLGRVKAEGRRPYLIGRDDEVLGAIAIMDYPMRPVEHPRGTRQVSVKWK